ncbi:hypothetical protein KFE25_001413 [Diacronema lutheri]|uniref:Uncharacterized protein n=1 Tax=Diacronema lutheri TaxID=2081491 RepID=A0A8J6C9N8_DIALT|nr:hypothetical protein KFE25_001413 [Diacronema lutheri]
MPPLLIGPKETRYAGRATGVGVRSSATLWADVSLARARAGDGSPASLRSGDGSDVGALSGRGLSRTSSLGTALQQSLVDDTPASAASDDVARPAGAESAPRRRSLQLEPLRAGGGLRLPAGRRAGARARVGRLVSRSARVPSAPPSLLDRLDRANELYHERLAQTQQPARSGPLGVAAEHGRPAPAPSPAPPPFGLLAPCALLRTYAPPAASPQPRARRALERGALELGFRAAATRGAEQWNNPLDVHPLSVVPALAHADGKWRADGGRPARSASRVRSPPANRPLSPARQVAPPPRTPDPPVVALPGVVCEPLAAPAPRPRSQPRPAGSQAARHASTPGGEGAVADRADGGDGVRVATADAAAVTRGSPARAPIRVPMEMPTVSVPATS